MKGYAPGWQIRCCKCGWTVDAGEAGIIQLGGIGRSYKLRWRPQCRWLRLAALEKKGSYKTPPQTASDPGIQD